VSKQVTLSGRQSQSDDTGRYELVFEKEKTFNNIDSRLDATVTVY